ncbi:Uncharacterised protein [Vibrio cholerae]|nr:Uncharacterised protein [Vibrio cholerae]
MPHHAGVSSRHQHQTQQNLRRSNVIAAQAQPRYCNAHPPTSPLPLKQGRSLC